MRKWRQKCVNGVSSCFQKRTDTIKLSYYFDHREEITAMMALEEQGHAEFSGP